MKSKIIMIIAMLAVMVTMMGIAIAETTTQAILTGSNDPVIIGIGDTGTQTVTLSLDCVTVGETTACTIPATPISKIEILDVPTGISTTIDGSSGQLLTGPWGNPKSWSIGITNDAATADEYIITYRVTYLNGLSQTRKATIQAGINAVPEFPTVALPIAAVIGLVFFFQNKKKKE